MPDLHVSFTLTPALVITALVFDAGLIALAISAVRHLRHTRRPAAAEAERARASLR